MTKKKSFISKLILGKEKSEEYARSTLPTNRWELGWDIFKSRFWQLTLTNVIMILFFAPVIAVFVFRYMGIVSYGSLAPFSSGFGVGYGGVASMSGFPEQIVLNVDLIFYLFLPIAFLFASLGISGGAYVLRNMVWTEGIFVANDFWRGIKINFKQIVLLVFSYSVFLTLMLLAIDFLSVNSAYGGSVAWLFSLGKVVGYVAIAFISIVALYAITLSVTYDYKFIELIKNAFVFTVGLIVRNVFFLFLGLIPFLLLLLDGILKVIALLLVVLIGFSYFLLVWTDFVQGAFDKYINAKIPGAKTNRGIYEKVKNSNSEALKKYREQLVASGVTGIGSRPIKPITDEELQLESLPEVFTRKDILKVEQSRQNIINDNNKYVEEHKNDPEFVEIQKLKEESEKDKQSRIEKARKELEKSKKKGLL